MGRRLDIHSSIDKVGAEADLVPATDYAHILGKLKYRRVREASQ